MIDAAVFDFDGTLVQSNLIKFEAWRDVAAMAGVEHSRVLQFIAATPHADRYTICDAMASMRTVGSQTSIGAEDLAAHYGNICRDMIAACPEVAGATALLRWLMDRKIPAFVNSATPRTALEDILRMRDWLGYFKDVLGRPADKVSNLKHVIDAGDFQAHRVVVVGDGKDDQDAAAACGCFFVGIESEKGNQANAFTVMPDLIFPDLTSLAAALEQRLDVSTRIGSNHE